MWDKPLPLRPHHGLCMAFFRGEGYSSGFISALAACLTELEADDPMIILTVSTDIVCASCPHNTGGICHEAEKVASYDRAVLERCGLEAETVCTFSEFTNLVQRKILSRGRRREVCGNCEWDRLCSSTPSRWAARF